MAKIKKIKEGTATVYPATIPQAVIDPTSGKSVRTELNEKEAVANKKQTVTNSATDYPSGAAVTASLALKTDTAELNKIYPLYNYNVRVGTDSGSIGNIEELAKLYNENLALLDSTVFLWSGVSGMKTRTSGSNQFASKLYNMANKVQQFGSELVTNGTFTGADGSTPAGWTGNGSTITVDSNRLKSISTVSFGNAYQSITTIIGKTYHLSYSFTYIDCQGEIKVSSAVGGAAIASRTLNATASSTISFVATSTTTFINLVNYSGTTGLTTIWDNISVKQMDWIEGTNDAVQTTEANQPYVGGVIAPNEVRKLKGYVGSSDYVDFNPVVFASNSPWSVSFTAKNNSSKGNLDTGVIVSDSGAGQTSWIGFGATEPNLRFRNRAGDVVSIPNLAPYGEIGKNGIYSLVSLGNNAIQVFKNSVLITTISVETGITIARIMDTLTSPNRQLNGELSHLQIHNRALSASEIQAQHDYLRLQIPEIEGIAIGNQYWPTSNYEGVVAGDGSVINEVQEANNVDKLSGTGNFENGLIGTKTDADGVVSTWSLNTTNPISGTQDGRLVVSTTGVGGNSQYRPILTIPFTFIVGRSYLVKFDYKVNSGTAIWTGVSKGSGQNDFFLTQLTGTGNAQRFIHITGTASSSILLYFNGQNLFDLQIDNLSIEEVGWSQSTALYDAVYAQTSGTPAQQELAALKAAAMWNYPDNNVSIGAITGKMYNGYATLLINKYPPIGYRVGSYNDQLQLSNYLGGNLVAGAKLKALYGAFNNSYSTNESGFSAIPAGYISAQGVYSSASNSFIANCDGVNVGYMSLLNSIIAIQTLVNTNVKSQGFSIRLLRNSPVGPNENTVTTGTSIHALGAGNLDIVIPFGYAVDSIKVISKTGITGLSAKYCSRNTSTLAVTELDTLFTAKTVVADIPKLFNCNVDQTIQRQDAVVRINGTKADTAAEFEVRVNIKKVVL